MSCEVPCLHNPHKCDFCGCLMRNSTFYYYIYVIYYYKHFYYFKPNFSNSTHLQVCGWAALLGSDPLPWHVTGWGCFFYLLNYFQACVHLPLSLGRGSSSTSLSESPCSSLWSVCSPAAVWGGWGVTRSASATPSAPPASGLTYTEPRTDIDPAPSTCSEDKMCTEVTLTSQWIKYSKTIWEGSLGIHTVLFILML